MRADHEWEAGHLPGATHLPLARARRSAPARSTRSGRWSSTAAAATAPTWRPTALADAGYDAVKLSEGIVGWAEEGLPLDPEGGYVAESGEAAAVLQARKRAS